MSDYRSSLVQMIKDVAGVPASGAEIGVFRGDTSAAIRGSFLECHLYLVDAWSEWPDGSSYRRRHNNGNLSQSEWDLAYNQAVSRVSNPKTVLRMSSELAAKEVPDRSLDFVFIDADHTYEHVKMDIELWLPKTRRLICGHDYGSRRDMNGRWGVSRAVHELLVKTTS